MKQVRAKKGSEDAHTETISFRVTQAELETIESKTPRKRSRSVFVRETLMEALGSK